MIKVEIKEFKVGNKATRQKEVFLFGISLFSIVETTTNSNIVAQFKSEKKNERIAIKGFNSD